MGSLAEQARARGPLRDPGLDASGDAVQLAPSKCASPGPTYKPCSNTAPDAHTSLGPAPSIAKISNEDGDPTNLDFVRHQDGFIATNLYLSNDGTQVINLGGWRDQAAYEAFLAKAPEAVPAIFHEFPTAWPFA